MVKSTFSAFDKCRIHCKDLRRALFHHRVRYFIGKLVQIVKVDGIDAMTDDVVDYCFVLAKTVGAFLVQPAGAAQFAVEIHGYIAALPDVYLKTSRFQ